jgi:hypothetical protein
MTTESVTKGREAYPVWKCARDHANDMGRATCRECGESRPCQRCGGRPARLYVSGMWCDACDVVAPSSFVASRPESVRPVPVEQAIVLERQRSPERAGLPAGIRTLIAWCENQNIEREWASGRTVHEGRERESVILRARLRDGGVLVVVYEDGRFVRSIGTMIAGKGTLTDARRALGLSVAPRKPRKPAAAKPVAEPKRATKTNTMR